MTLGKFLLSSFIILSISSYNSFSQVSDSLFNLSCNHEDLIILNEEMEVNITGKKTFLMIASVTNSLTLIINKPEGINEFQPIKLPKKFDELYINHAPAIRNIDWAYDNVQIQNIDAKIINNNSQKEVEITKEVKSKRVLNLAGFFGNISEFEYYLGDIVVGDTIEINYTYNIPFKDNWIRLLSNRIFFNGKYPKKEYTLSWCHSKDLEIDTLFPNNATPNITHDGNRVCYNWEFKNLPGCLDEPGSRPYKTLPNFVFVPQSYDFEYTHFNSYVQEFIPSYFLQSSKRQDEIQTEYWDNVIGNKNRNNNSYQKIAKRIIALTPNDSIGVARLRYFQQFMVDSVTYNPAINYYKHNEDQMTQRAGVNLKARIIKDNAVERVYGNMVPKLGLELYTAYPVDIRVGEISPHYTATVKDNDLLFGVALKNNTLGFVVPKSDKNHYYFEELPFYYEEIPMLLLHYLDFPNRLEKRNFNTNFRKVTSPASRWKDNYRKIQSKVNVDLQEKTTKFQTRIILSGQYSTLTRCVYLSLPIDSTINVQYHEPIWNVTEDVNLVNNKPQHPNIYYPFKTTITAEYIANDLVTTNNNNYQLELGNWFKMVYHKNINFETRFLDYYPDFIGSDNYSYMIEFDKPIKITSDIENIEITNKYGHLSFAIKQLSNNKLLVTCNYSILSKVVKKSSIGMVKELFDAITKINGTKISFQTVE